MATINNEMNDNKCANEYVIQPPTTNEEFIAILQDEIARQKANGEVDMWRFAIIGVLCHQYMMEHTPHCVIDCSNWDYFKSRDEDEDDTNLFTVS